MQADLAKIVVSSLLGDGPLRAPVLTGAQGRVITDGGDQSVGCSNSKGITLVNSPQLTQMNT